MIGMSFFLGIRAPGITDQHVEQFVHVPGGDYFALDVTTKNKNNYKIWPQAETVSGTTCEIIEMNQHDRWWVDVPTGRPMQRRFCFPQDPTALRYEINFQDYKDVSNTSIPQVISAKIYGNVIYEPELKNKVLQEMELQVDAISHNDDVSDDLFEKRSFPAGTDILVAETGQHFRVENEREDVWSRLAELKPVAMPGKPMRQLFSLTRMLLACAIVATLVAVITVVRRKLKT